MTLQEVLKSVDDLSVEDQSFLFNVLRERLTQSHKANLQGGRATANKKILIKSLHGFAAQSQLSSDDFARSKQDEIILENAVTPLPQEQRTVSDLDNGQDGFWDMTLRFRQRIQQENIVFTDEDFAGLRDRSVGREVEL